MNLTIAANWKMYKTRQETKDFLDRMKAMESDFSSSQVIICPPFTSLSTAEESLRNSTLMLGAQNMLWEAEGAFTGEISPMMLKDNGVRYVIIGHSERRWIMGETNEQINKKLNAAFDYNLTPIFCIGEKEEMRKAGETEKVIMEQMDEGLKGIDAEKVKNLIIAYEPVWAIGTGLAASAEDAREAADCIQKKLQEFLGDNAKKVKILYGGSVKKDNIGDFVALPNIHGALVGGASLQVDGFSGLIKAAQNAVQG